MIKTTLPLVLALALALTACDKNAENGAAKTGSTTALDSAQLAPETAPPAPSATDTAKPQSVVTHVAVMTTDSGDIEIELYGQDAPKAVKNFVGLAKKKFYDGIGFHRVVPGFVIQAGDPLTKDTSRRQEWGTGSESIYGERYEDELDRNTPSGARGYVEGAVALAHPPRPNSNGSQFFIVFEGQNAAVLPYEYTIFGFVRKGMDVAHKIEKSWQGADMIRNPVRIKTIKVTEVAAPKSGDTTASK